MTSLVDMISTLATPIKKKNEKESEKLSENEEEPREAIRLIDYDDSLDHDTYISLFDAKGKSNEGLFDRKEWIILRE